MADNSNSTPPMVKVYWFGLVCIRWPSAPILNCFPFLLKGRKEQGLRTSRILLPILPVELEQLGETDAVRLLRLLSFGWQGQAQANCLVPMFTALLRTILSSKLK